jgi:hypothetical protein
MKSKELKLQMASEIRAELRKEESEYFPTSITIQPGLKQAAEMTAAFLGLSKSKFTRDALRHYINYHISRMVEEVVNEGDDAGTITVADSDLQRSEDTFGGGEHFGVGGTYSDAERVFGAEGGENGS